MPKRSPAAIAVKQWLLDKGRTQQWLAWRLRINQGLLSNILRGYRMPSEDVANRVLKATGIDLLDRQPASADEQLTEAR